MEDTPSYLVTVQRIMLAVRVSAAVVNIAGNGMALAALRSSKHLSRVTRLLMGNQAVANLLLGTALMLQSIVALAQLMSGVVWFVILSVCACSAAANIFSLFVVFVHNFLSIRKLQTTRAGGLKYRGVILSVVSTWVLSVAIAGVPAAVTLAKGSQITMDIYIAFADIYAACYILFTLAVISTVVLMIITVHSINKQYGLLGDAGATDCPALRTIRLRYVEKKSRLIKSFMIITIAFVICWVSFCVAIGIGYVQAWDPDYIFVRVCVSLTAVNSSINSIVFIIRDSEFRKDVMNIIRGCLLDVCKEPRTAEEPVVLQIT